MSRSHTTKPARNGGTAEILERGDLIRRPLMATTTPAGITTENSTFTTIISVVALIAIVALIYFIARGRTTAPTPERAPAPPQQQSGEAAPPR